MTKNEFSLLLRRYRTLQVTFRKVSDDSIRIMSIVSNDQVPNENQPKRSTDPVAPTPARKTNDNVISVYSPSDGWRSFQVNRLIEVLDVASGCVLFSEEMVHED